MLRTCARAARKLGLCEFQLIRCSLFALQLRLVSSDHWPRVLEATLRVVLGVEERVQMAVTVRTKVSHMHACCASVSDSTALILVLAQWGSLMPAIFSHSSRMLSPTVRRAEFCFALLPNLVEIESHE